MRKARPQQYCTDKTSLKPKGKNPKIHETNRKSSTGPTRRLQNPSRKHQRCSRSSQNDFLLHFTKKSSTKPKGTPEPDPRTTILTLDPQRQDHARRNHLGFPVGLPPSRYLQKSMAIPPVKSVSFKVVPARWEPCLHLPRLRTHCLSPTAASEAARL